MSSFPPGRRRFRWPDRPSDPRRQDIRRGGSTVRCPVVPSKALTNPLRRPRPPAGRCASYRAGLLKRVVVRRRGRQVCPSESPSPSGPAAGPAQCRRKIRPSGATFGENAHDALAWGSLPLCQYAAGPVAARKAISGATVGILRRFGGVVRDIDHRSVVGERRRVDPDGLAAVGVALPEHLAGVPVHALDALWASGSRRRPGRRRPARRRRRRPSTCCSTRLRWASRACASASGRRRRTDRSAAIRHIEIRPARVPDIALPHRPGIDAHQFPALQPLDQRPIEAFGLAAPLVTTDGGSDEHYQVAAATPPARRRTRASPAGTFSMTRPSADFLLKRAMWTLEIRRFVEHIGDPLWIYGANDTSTTERHREANSQSMSRR